jgi:hypothetical protein
MFLPDDVPFDRRLQEDDGALRYGRRHGYRRREDIMLIEVLHKRRRAWVFGTITVLFVAVGVSVLIYLGAHQASINKGLTFKERESRVQNVVQLCNGVNDALSYIQLVVRKFATELPPPPHRLNCTLLIANTAASTR